MQPDESRDLRTAPTEASKKAHELEDLASMAGREHPPIGAASDLAVHVQDVLKADPNFKNDVFKSLDADPNVTILRDQGGGRTAILFGDIDAKKGSIVHVALPVAAEEGDTALTSKRNGPTYDGKVRVGVGTPIGKTADELHADDVKALKDKLNRAVDELNPNQMRELSDTERTKLQALITAVVDANPDELKKAGVNFLKDEDSAKRMLSATTIITGWHSGLALVNDGDSSMLQLGPPDPPDGPHGPVVRIDRQGNITYGVHTQQGDMSGILTGPSEKYPSEVQQTLTRLSDYLVHREER